MGMTDAQFKGYLRLLLDDLEDIEEQRKTAGGDIERKLKKIISNIQKTIED